mmetsp:Transcript_46567/g.98820  ORF Transcript_46567/g.98820 Transcript_46567/m.98820 type:complete len:232 (+) Transcript_46567:1052-1747(+)
MGFHLLHLVECTMCLLIIGHFKVCLSNLMLYPSGVNLFWGKLSQKFKRILGAKLAEESVGGPEPAQQFQYLANVPPFRRLIHLLHVGAIRGGSLLPRCSGHIGSRRGGSASPNPPLLLRGLLPRYRPSVVLTRREQRPLLALDGGHPRVEGRCLGRWWRGGACKKPRPTTADRLGAWLVRKAGDDATGPIEDPVGVPDRRGGRQGVFVGRSRDRRAAGSLASRRQPRRGGK